MSENQSRRKALGRGLSALIGGSAAATDQIGAQSVNGQGESPIASDSLQNSVRQIPIEQITPNPKQPRTRFDETTLSELAASIREHGILQPLIVTINQQQGNTFWLVAGERRWRAAQQAGLATVPVVVREATSQQMMEWALIENLQRTDLNAIEEAQAFQSLSKEFGLTQDEIATRVGKSRSAVTNTMRLLKLPLNVQSAVVDSKISEGHARVLLSLPNERLIERAFNEITRRELNVRQAEALVRQFLEEPGDAPSDDEEVPIAPQLKAHLNYLENRFRLALGTKVSLKRNNNGSGKLVVHFFNDDDLDSIYRIVAGRNESE